MYDRNVIWSPIVMEKLTLFRGKRFTPEETLDFITQFILETEDILGNEFRVYYKLIDKDVGILSVLFPGEN